MADSLASFFGPYAGVSAALPESSVTPNRPPPDLLLHNLASMFTLPQRAIESAATYQQGGGYDPAPIVEAATLPMRAGVGGAPMRAGEVAFGAGPVRGSMERYNQALAEGRITPAEHAGFAEALGGGPDIGAVVNALTRQNGIASIGDVLNNAGMTKEQLHSAILDAVKAGTATIHPTTRGWANLSRANQDAAITIPGHPDPFVHILMKDSGDGR
jgi:hypothetical protein